MAGRGISKEDVNILVEFRDTIPNGTTIEHEIISAILNLPPRKILIDAPIAYHLVLRKNVIGTYKTYHILLDDMKLSAMGLRPSKRGM